ncbi:amidohydrolase family protein (plasmid) [Sinorhizobium meliloti]|uniref:amidohydrolase family protein n=1 Tax=Rhizobium meliloti TaxID=382 RepID=UPI00299D08BF|nr:amidohydrolase family protein [Sinorhizobium meliloti]MDX0225700.1 amidohydrolase family protein [Sinorhizobium meliloti]
MSENGTVTVIRNCEWLVAWDAVASSHVYKKNGDLAFAGDRILHVGKSYNGHFDVEIDGRRRMIMPGFVDIHAHPGHEPGWKGMLEELGSPKLGQSSLYEFMPVFNVAAEYGRHACRVAVSELLKSGVTTICDLGGAREGWAEDYAEMGIRAVLWVMFRSGPWYTRDGHSVGYDLDFARGDRLLREAIAAADEASGHASGRIQGFIAPAQVDTCSEGQIRDALAAARDRGQPIQIHAAQSIIEFQEIVRRYGETPIGWLAKIGALGEDTVVGHGIFLNDHPFLHYPHADDFSLLRDSGAQVAHCPVVFARRGIAMNTLHRYRKAGIRCGIGTDTFPHNMLDELRMACYAGRIVAGSFTAASTAEAFTAATSGGADIIRRPDLGRLAPGCKADFSIVDMTNPYMQPDYEPLRSLVYSANDRAIRDVYVDGVKLVANGQLVAFAIDEDIEMLRRAQQEVIANAPARDWAGRSVESLSPRVFPIRS